MNVVGAISLALLAGAMSGNRKSYKRKHDSTGVQITEENKQDVYIKTIGLQR